MKLRTVAMFLAALFLPFALHTQPQRALPPASQMKMLGLIGGTSWYSTIEYYRYINKAVNEAYGDNTNPPLLLYNLNQREVHDLQLKNDWGQIAGLLTEASNRLHAGGAQAILFCANTPHKVYAQVAAKIDVPILHIGDAIGPAVRQKGLKKVGLIGTQYTMEDGFIPDWLQEHYGIETIVPSSPAVRKELHRIVQKELGMGIFKPESKKYVLQQISELRQRGAQGIILGCTEFPLIIKQTDVSMPVFDTTALHSQMAVDYILGSAGLAHVTPE